MTREAQDNLARLERTLRNTPPQSASAQMLNRYSREAVDKEIRKDKRIGKREAALIHALLKGRK